MKKFFNKILSLGIHPDQTLHQARMVRTTNLLNVLVFLLVTSSFSTALVLREKYDIYPIIFVLVLASLSIYLNARRQALAAYHFFAFYINLAICYFTLSHPASSDMYVYFFPVIVSLVLLNTAAFSGYSIIWSALMSAVFMTLAFTVKIPSIQIHLSLYETNFLRNFNVIGASVITALLSFLLTRIISRQFNEITQQNTSLILAKEQVNNSLKEKEVLLAELHHRVKNNLAIISGLLNLQDDATSSIEAKDVIRDSKSRIMSMALVHRMLYEKSELKSLDLCRYTSELLYELFNSYDLVSKVRVEVNCEKITLPVNKSVPLGLILNEIVTNSIKYAFKRQERNNGKFVISIKQLDQQVQMLVKDDGDGFPLDFEPDSENVSLGIFLIKSLTEQIDGTVKFYNEGGACIELVFALD